MSTDIEAAHGTADALEPLVIKRVFRAPVPRVYEAWTDPKIMTRWFSSNIRWRSPEVLADVTPGGEYRITMIHSDGDRFLVAGRYIEVVKDERLAFTWAWLDGPMVKEQSQVTVEFRAHPEGTELTLTHDMLIDPEGRAGTSDGWAGCLEMLESCLSGKPLLS